METFLALMPDRIRVALELRHPPCPDVEVVFARGTFEAPDVGFAGRAIVDALRGKLGDKNVDVYAVNYPASLDFQRAADGIVDASRKVEQTAAACPSTKIVIGGFSQGAAVVSYLTADSVPANFVLPDGITAPIPDDVAEHVTAGTLFGKPSSGFINTVQSTVPPINIGHPYTDRTVDLCIETDPVCSPTGGDGRATTCTRPTAWSNRPPTMSPRESWRGQHGRHTEG